MMLKRPNDADPKPLPELLTVPEVATFLRTTPSAIYTAVERGQLPGVVRIGRRVLFNADMLRAWIAEKTTGPESTPEGAVLQMRRGRRCVPTPKT